MIELALFIPVLMLILLGGADLVRLVILQNKTEAAAAVIASSLATAPALESTDFTSALILAKSLTNEESVAISIRASRTSMNGHTQLWQQNLGETACSSNTASLPSAAATSAAALNLDVALCVTPTADFYLSGLLASAAPSFSANVMAIGSSLALRATPEE